MSFPPPRTAESAKGRSVRATMEGAGAEWSDGGGVVAIRSDANRAHPDLSQGPADLRSAALATELCTHMYMTYRQM